MQHQWENVGVWKYEETWSMCLIKRNRDGDRDKVCLVSVFYFLIQGPLCSKCNIKARWNRNKSNIAEAWRERAERIRFMAEVKERLAEPLISANLSIRSNAKARAAFRLALSCRHRHKGTFFPVAPYLCFSFVLLKAHLRFDKLDGRTSFSPSCAETCFKAGRTLCNRIPKIYR